MKIKTAIVSVLGIALLIAFAGLFPVAIRADRYRVDLNSCVSRLSQIGKLLAMHGMESSEAYPASFGELLAPPTYGAFTNLFVCPATDARPGARSNVVDWTTYLYVSGKSPADHSGDVVAYCPPENHRGLSGNILFVDGSVGTFPSNEFWQIVKPGNRNGSPNQMPGHVP